MKCFELAKASIKKNYIYFTPFCKSNYHVTSKDQSNIVCPGTQGSLHIKLAIYNSLLRQFFKTLPDCKNKPINIRHLIHKRRSMNPIIVGKLKVRL